VTEADSQRNLERLVAELREQVAAHRRRGRIVLIVQLDGSGRVTEQSHVEPGWVYPVQQ
jgi:hypothetical protein